MMLEACCRPVEFMAIMGFQPRVSWVSSLGHCGFSVWGIAGFQPGALAVDSLWHYKSQPEGNVGFQPGATVGCEDFNTAATCGTYLHEQV